MNTVKLGSIVFCNDSGLGAQTRRLAQFLKPYRLLAIDSSSFSKNTAQHFDWYKSFSGYRVHGFPTNHEIKVFLQGLTHVIVCENPLNPNLLTLAEQMKIKVYIQSNYEFCDHLNRDLSLPYKFLMPSYWHVDTMKNRFGQDRVEYLPPPIFPDEFEDARSINMARSGRRRFLHVVGTLAAADRNGTLDLLKAFGLFSKEDYELVIKSQHDLPEHYYISDPRITYQIGNEGANADLFKNFDALILPRRYGGLSLTTNEALMSSLPVVMTDISPNNALLYKKWLIRSEKKDELVTRAVIDVYSASHVSLGQKLDQLATMSDDQLRTWKEIAYKIGYDTFSPEVLTEKYNNLWH